MARLESIAVGGYYKTPTHLLPRIALLLEPYFGQQEVTLMDPCAGDGEAVRRLAAAWGKGFKPKIYACEMEATRAAAYEALIKDDYASKRNLLVGDAFRINFSKKSSYGSKASGVSVLFLNPPYDTDRQHGRLEQKFLDRFAEAVALGGHLVFVVPYYALKASAEFLGTHFDNLHCFKFPEEDFEAFKQIVLVAEKVDPRLTPDLSIISKVVQWSKSVDSVPVLPNLTCDPVGSIQAGQAYTEAIYDWKMKVVDLQALAKKAKPWTDRSRGGEQVPVHGVLPDLPIEELLLRKYPLAMPPRPAHIAAGIASGIFNGSKVVPDPEYPDLPPLLVKGVFDQEWKTVEEKANKDGEITSVVQIQQPKLVATVLDLRNHTYHTLKSEASVGSGRIEDLSVGGLLKFYGTSLMQVMGEQCPVMYDPRTDGPDVPLRPTKRTLFTAQEHATRALLRLLGGPGIPIRKRTGKGAILLGEIGSGKTSVATALAHSMDSKRPLVLCPPHLLDSWTNEVREVLEGVEVKVLKTVSDLEDLARDTRDEMIVSVLSRETAKLSHGWTGVKHACPKCGAALPLGDLAKKRIRCKHKTLQGGGVIGKLVRKLANQLLKYDPTGSTVQALLKGRWDQKRIEYYEEKKKKDELPLFPGFSQNYFDEVIEELKEATHAQDSAEAEALVWVLHSLNRDQKIVECAKYFVASDNYSLKELGRDLALMLRPNSDVQKELIQYIGYLAQNRIDDTLSESAWSKIITDHDLKWYTGNRLLQKVPAGSLSAAKKTLYKLGNVSGLIWSEPCGEILFQAVPEPRRVALASYIQRRHSKVFDFMILDECHEYSSQGSAQEVSAHRLAGMGAPTLLMTGSVMNGYAESLFMNMWAVSEDFRREFQRGDKALFNDRYGYRKRLVQEKDEHGDVIEFGSMSDRVTRSARNVGNAPGVLPLFLLRHLLPCSVTLHKSDLAIDLPPCTQERIHIDPGPILKGRYLSLQSALVQQIKKDRWEPELAGKLFGQLAELPSFLDRATADTGNSEDGFFRITYPASVGGHLVAEQDPFDASEILPKEEWLLNRIESEIEEGRNVLVFSWHVTLMPRLARLISERIGEKIPVLHANKVTTAKRQAWIDKQVVKKNAKVLVVNPVAVQTGLNNLVHFSTEIWMENPACNSWIYRQAIGRVDRIGARKPTRILTPVYEDTLQQTMYELLLQKVAVSISTDGLDPESAMLAAGIGTDEFMTGLSIGKQLWAMLSENFE